MELKTVVLGERYRSVFVYVGFPDGRRITLRFWACPYSLSACPGAMAGTLRPEASGCIWG
jgi:hypothetical protein